MRISWFILLLGFHFVCSAQQYYLTGRPYTLERNNAIIEVGKRWGLTIEFVGGDVYDETGVDSINRINDRAAKLKGENWTALFYEEVDQLEGLHNEIRKAFSQSSMSLGGGSILVTSIKRKMYHVTLIDINNQGTSTCKGMYRCRVKRRMAFRLEKTCQIPYAIPQNGLILP